MNYSCCMTIKNNNNNNNNNNNICIDVGDPTEIDPECDKDSDSVIIPDGHEQMGASDIRNAIMDYI